ncbi:hypothetical protein KAT36_04035 [Candidatus Pacearchaeota archaeon]|nr:hypothetical protein [Candidatus Pacearchaeota archaeon]
MKKTKLERGFKKEWKNILFNSIFVGVAILIVTLFHKNIMLTTILEIILAIVGLSKWKSKRTFAIFIFAGMFGTIAEMIVIYTSYAWSYASPTLMQLIPTWLFVVWANAGAFLYETSKEIHKLGVNK